MKKLSVATIGLALGLALALGPVPASHAQKNDANTRSVLGQATDRGGGPLEKAVVYLKNTKTLQVRTYITDERGEFHFQGLSTDADYELHAEHDGASSPRKTISAFDSRKEIQVTLKIDKK